MLDRGFQGEISFSCDYCNDELETGERDFADAVNEMHDDDWYAVKDKDGVWIHFCTESCKKQFELKKDFG